VRTETPEARVLKEYLPSALVRRANDGSLAPQPDNEEDYHRGLQRFLSDARALLSVRHANLVEVTDVIEANATAYVAMRRVQGERLADALKHRATFSGEQLLRLSLALLDATLALHAAGLIHRDIRENNILLRPDGSPVLLDFGATRVGLMRRRLALGETGNGEDFDDSLDGGSGPWTDIHALSALLFRLANSMAQKSGSETSGCPREVVDALRRGVAAQPGNVDIVVAEWRQELVSLQQRLYPASAQPEKMPPKKAMATELQADVSAEDYGAIVAATGASAEPTDSLQMPVDSVAVGASESTAERTRSGKSASRKQRKKAQQREKRARRGHRRTHDDSPAAHDANAELAGNSTMDAVSESAPVEVVAASAQVVSGVANNSQIAAAALDSNIVHAMPTYADAQDELVLDLTTGTYEPMTRSAVLPRLGFFARHLGWAFAAALGALLLVTAVLFRHRSQEPDLTTRLAPDATSMEPASASAVASPSIAALQASTPVAPMASESALPATSAPAAPTAPPSIAALQESAPVTPVASESAISTTPVPAATVAIAPAATQTASPAVEPTPTAASATTANQTPDAAAVQTQVGELLAKANEDIDALRLSSPEGQNAMEKLKQVLKLQPDNADAARAITSISSKYIDLAAGAMSRQQLTVAKRYIDLAQAIDPNNPAMPAARARLGRLEREAKETHSDANVVAEHDTGPATNVDQLLPAEPETPPAETTSRAEEMRRRLGGNSN
jgi:hypothetical protein